VNFGYASGFQGKIQKFRISNEESPIESATACGAPVKQLSNALSVRKDNNFQAIWINPCGGKRPIKRPL